MRARGANAVGRFSVELEVANYGDLALMQRGLLPPDQVRWETIQGVVDSGATKLVLPEAVVKRLGLTLGGKFKVKYAFGRRAQRQEVRVVFVKLLERDGTFTTISEPKRETALIGAIVPEDLGLLVDCSTRRVVPRDTRGAIYEIQ
jgi:predicted aspartyl protease